MSVRLINGDCREVLRTLPDASVQMCVTSPPYFGLRDYGTGTWEGGDPGCDHTAPPNGGRKSSGLNSCGGEEQLRYIAKLENKNQYSHTCGKCGAHRVDAQIGLEKTPDEYIATLVGVFREVWRVLRNDGTAWINIGDGYASSGPKQLGRNDAGRNFTGGGGNKLGSGNPGKLGVGRTIDYGAKPKDLLGIPWMVAFALRADGWHLRSAITWAKPNPLPESCTDRPTGSYEMVFLLAKSGSSTYWTHRDLVGTRIQPEPDYRYVHRTTGEERIDDPGDKKNWRRVNLWSGHDYFYDANAIREGAEGDSNDRRRGDGAAYHKQRRDAIHGTQTAATHMGVSSDGTRNARNVWTIASAPFPGQHYATFPPELPERCIKAGTSEAGTCSHCGAPWERIVEKGEPDREHQISCGGSANDGGYNGTALKDYAAAKAQNASDVNRRILEGMRTKRTTGWRPTCSCPEHTPVPCVVLDCFAGSGTTGMVADRLGRDAVLIELKRDGLAQDRITKDCPLFAEVVA